ncbi:hypothetical protein N665_1059s0009 [Sinapis alba]|nr:hypothetical protein N665_1059s0009 [Sinapis alba]
MCNTCGFQGESVNHIMFGCSVARQVWELTNILLPFMETLRMIPWIIWFLWKNRNGVLFECVARRTNELIMKIRELIMKIREEVEFWFLAQEHWEELNAADKVEVTQVQNKWRQPPMGWLKYNIGVMWDRQKRSGGCSWVVRDARGDVLMHSRKAFFNLSHINEARMRSLIWSIEIMKCHRLNKVIFALEDSMIVGMVTRPRAWPSFKSQTKEILYSLSKLEWWRLVMEEKITNT